MCERPRKSKVFLVGDEPQETEMASALVEFSNGLADAVERAGKSVVAVLEGGRSGVSGTVWREGIVVTAEHTIRGEEEVTLVLPSGENVKAKVVGGDPSTDVAVLKVDAKVAPAAFADGAKVKTGHVVLAIGRRGEEGVSASFGMVSATGGAWRTWQGGKIDHYLRLDLNPYPGFSGGPLIDASGAVLGINTSGPRRSVMTTPNVTVDRVVDALLKRGRIARGFLGVGVQPVAFPEASKATLGLERNRGLLVITITEGGPAEKAGLMIGDIVVAVDGNAVAHASDLQAALDPEKVGNAIVVKVLRGGKLQDVKLTVGERAGRE
jgi:S1-C subfamily serine protease